MTATRISSDTLDVLVVDDDELMRDVFEPSLEEDGHRVTFATTGRQALELVQQDVFDLAFLDLQLGHESGLELISPLREHSPWIKIVLVTGHATIEAAVEAMKRGATDFITKPFSPTHLRVIAERQASIRRLERRATALSEDADRLVPTPYLESQNPAMRRALATARKVADTDATVLVGGESGTGKGVLARAIHEWSGRAREPFCVISCPTLTPELLRSELFGHVRGAFTGAVSNNPGKIVAADNGTLFLDEIGDLPPSIQPQLLRFLQDREFERLGETKTRTANVRVITATSKDLGSAVEKSEFRVDLWYRLRVIEIDIPPLRERREDILPLAEMFLRFFARRYGPGIIGFSEEAKAFLQEYDWPGNARELQNAVERATILCQTDTVDIHLFPVALSRGAGVGPLPLDGELVSLEEMEARYIRHVLRHTDSIERAAEVLHVAPSTLWRRRRKYGI